MKLLRQISIEGAPDDYLFARIRCRRAALEQAGGSGSLRTDEPRTALRTEYNWVYRQMNRTLRGRFLPLFEYFEVRTLVVALRYLAAGDRPALTSQLQQSLLHPQLLMLVKEGEQVASLLSALERLLAEAYPCFGQLTATYLRQGPGGLEQALLGGYLQRGIAEARSRQIRDFLRSLLDVRNLQALFKHLRWQVPLAPPLLSGGNLTIADCEKVWAGRNMSALLELMRRAAAASQPPAEDEVEDYLLDGLSRSLRLKGRDPLQEGVVIDYLWRCQRAARQQGLQLATAEEYPLAETAG